MRALSIFIMCILASNVQALETSSGLDLSLKWIDFPISQAATYPVNDQLYQGELKANYESHFSESTKFTSKLYYAADPSNKSSEEQNFVDLPEFNFKWKGESASVKVGNEIYTWGITDGFNPVDFVNTKQYFDPIHAQKLGAPSLSTSFGGESYDADLVYIPRARSAILPGTNSRWLPRNIYVSGSSAGTGVQLNLPKQFNYTYSNSDPLDSALDNNFAMRMQLRLGSAELAFYGYDGVAQMPIVTPHVSGTSSVVWPVTIIQVNSNVRLDLQDYRQRVGAFSASKTVGEWQLKGVGSWTQSYSGANNKQGWSNAAVVAAEKTWSPSENATLVTIFQYAYCERQGFSGNDMMAISSFFNRNAMLGGQFMWKDTDTLTYFYSNDTNTQSWMSDLSYEHHLSDALKIGAKATVLDGSATSPLGVYSDNKNLSVNLNWTL